MPIYDLAGRIVALFASRPDDHNWPRLQAQAAKELEEARHRTHQTDATHRHGDFSTLRCGVSHGGGRTRPMNFCNSKQTANVLNELNNSEPFVRLAGFGSCVYLPLCGWGSN